MEERLPRHQEFCQNDALCLHAYWIKTIDIEYQPMSYYKVHVAGEPLNFLKVDGSAMYMCDLSEYLGRYNSTKYVYHLDSDIDSRMS